LNVVPIALPPLRERLADIVPLAEHFLVPSGKRPHVPRRPVLPAERRADRPAAPARAAGRHRAARRALPGPLRQAA
ncbi:sigma-54-dependent Fis family transcriptional regulator, partial [Methylobacterium radiotolerans]